MRRAADKAREEGVAVATATERNAGSGDASAFRRREESWVTLLVGRAEHDGHPVDPDDEIRRSQPGVTVEFEIG